MQDCFSCKIISTGAFFASSAYLAYGAKYWTNEHTKSRVNRKFLYPFSFGNYSINYAYNNILVLLTAGVINWILRSKNEKDN